MRADADKPRPALPEGPYLVVGLARSGQAVARLLAARGDRVLGCDTGTPDGAAELAGLGIEVDLAGDGLALLDRAAAVVKSPGVPREAPVVAAALDRELPVLGELELAWRLLPNRFVGVTGTNGKTTVTELLRHIWRRAGRPVEVAGNVGTPLASLAGRVDPAATVICECSSFQLEDAEAFAPECGLLLNVTPDHLDRHRSLAEYLQAKLRLFARQGPGDVCVYNGSDPALRGVELGGRGRRVEFCADAGGGGEGCRGAVRGGAIELGGERLVGLDELPLPGPHNAANAAAAAAAAEAMGIEREAIAAALVSFAGVPHRLERVGVRGGVAYVNDSKATNVAAAAAALRSFTPGTVRAILGGSSKGDRFTGLASAVAERCAACYLIGEAAGALERDLAPAWEAGVARRRCDGLAAAVDAAAADAAAGEVVVLVPACASFDAYRDYEQRGEHFRALVAGLGA
ncbi:MAG TPA: UDP-N-acetylmuramoyl-L-alanine--D-glutamate ligase [Solirubrobacterales bacterium]|nr:UDP-N-acetylmuramoyl-L-alanine--D-glutamate ligase [Solirubrobacterales bacterium]